MPAGTETVIYVRVSLDKTGKELAIDRQEAVCRELCEKNGWPVLSVVRDNSVSAVKAKKRPGFEKLLAMKPKHIVMWSADRLVRKGPDLERLIQLNTPIHSAMSGPMNLANAAGRLHARLLTDVATFEGEIKAERQQAAAVQRAQMGGSWWPTRPFGLERDGTLNEAEAAGLRKAYSDILAGAPLSAVAADLNAAGLLTNKGNPWTGMTIRPVLMNARNAAIRVYKGVEVGPAAWSPIVPEETWRAAVRLLNQPARRTGGGGKRLNLMTGFAKCGVCGGDVKTEYRGRKGEIGAYTVYACRLKHCLSHRSKWVDDRVETLLLERLSLPDAAALWAVGQDVDAGQVREDAVSMRERLDALAEDYAEGLISRAQMVTGSTRLRERLAEAEGLLARMAGDSPLLELLSAKDKDAAWEGLTLAKKRTTIEMLIEKVSLYPRGRGRVEHLPEHCVVEWKDSRPHLSAVS